MWDVGHRLDKLMVGHERAQQARLIAQLMKLAGLGGLGPHAKGRGDVQNG